MAITADKARIELAKRELLRREASKNVQPMFKDEASGRLAIGKQQQEQVALKSAASPLGIAKTTAMQTGRDVLGGINAGINTVVPNVLGVAENLSGQPIMQRPTGSAGYDIAQGAGMGIGMLSNPYQKLAGMALGQVGNLPKVINLGGAKTAQKIAEKADEGFGKAFGYLSNKYDNLFSRIKEGSTKIDDVLESINEAAVNSNTGSSIEKKMTRLFDELGKSGEATAERLHRLKQEIRAMVPKSVWKGTGDANMEQHYAKEAYYKVNDALERIGGKEYSGLSNEYKDFMKATDLTKQFFYEKGQPSNLGMMRTMSEPAKRSLEVINKNLAPEEKFVQEFEAWRRGQVAKKIALGGGGVTLADYIARRIYGRSLLNVGQ